MHLSGRNPREVEIGSHVGDAFIARDDLL